MDLGDDEEEEEEEEEAEVAFAVLLEQGKEVAAEARGLPAPFELA